MKNASFVAEPQMLADGEQHFFIPGPVPGLRLFLRLLKSSRVATQAGRCVLYVHGATFPSGLSVAHRFDGRSWRDALCDAGFDVWALDFYGFGHSDRYAEMDAPAEAHSPLGLAEGAAEQVAATARFILEHAGQKSLSVIAHSWGSMVAGRFAGEHPTWVDRLVFFAPICWREAPQLSAKPDGPAWRTISVEDQWKRFVEDVPPNEPPVLSRRHFNDWAERYLDSDPRSRTRDRPAVKTPSGPFVEILRAWNGESAYDPARVLSPVAIVRGAWDTLVTDSDARWLFDALCNAPAKRDIKIGRATHLMHLESMRLALWRESSVFLLGEDMAPVPA
jgi:pimeloyl-ACP methyl ester carboxylesterase